LASTARKLNFMISEDVALELDKLVPPRQRSRVVNEALKKELDSIRHRQLTEELNRLRELSPRLTTPEIVSILRRDRKRG